MALNNGNKALRKIIALTAALLLAFLILTCLYQVKTNESAVLTTFEKPLEFAITEPGLHVKAPWPIQKAYIFDMRKRLFVSPFMEFLVKDGFNVITRVFVIWSVKDANIYKNRVGVTVSNGEKIISELVTKHLKSVISEYSLADILKPADSDDTGSAKISAAEEKILQNIATESLSQFGIETSFFGFDRIELPEDCTEAVFNRMKSERMKMVTKISEEGKAKADKLKKEAELAKNKMLAEAEAEAVRIKGEADTKAFEYLAVYDKNPEFALFLRKLQALEDSMKNKTTIVIDKTTPPFDLLSGPRINNTEKTPNQNMEETKSAP